MRTMLLVLCLAFLSSDTAAEGPPGPPGAEPDELSVPTELGGPDDKVEWQLPDYADQQMCYSWIALTAGYGEPPEIRKDWEKIAYRISRSLHDRVEDETEAGKKAADEAIAVTNKWMMDHAAAHVEDKVRMVLEAMAKAKNCMDMVPPEEIL